MTKYIVKRIVQAIPLLLLITIICFGMINLAPYDAVDAITTPDMSRKEVELRKEEYGLNDPMIVQYGKWIKNILHGDWGYSIRSHTSISYDLRHRIPATMQLVIPAYATAYLLSIVLGLITGSKKDSMLDKIIDGACSIGIATPTFWIAMLLMFLLGYYWKIFPLMGMHTIGQENSIIDYLRHFAMPYMVLTMGFLPDLTRYVRNSTISQFKEDYVMVQKAFGASRAEILRKHVAKNVILPLITKLGMALPMLVTGAVLTETIFAWPGIGPYFVSALKDMDYPIVMSILVLSGTLVILGNLLSDILCCVIDPRIKTKKES